MGIAGEGMAKSPLERQQEYQKKLKEGTHRRVTAIIPNEDASLLDHLAWFWNLPKKEALARALRIAWEAAGRPKKSDKDSSVND
jgi:hypothetical protein